MKLFRTKYKFTHPEAEGPIFFKAWSEEGAWKKMENFVVMMMYGKWALTYHPGPVRKVLNECKCEAV